MGLKRASAGDSASSAKAQQKVAPPKTAEEHIEARPPYRKGTVSMEFRCLSRGIEFSRVSKDGKSK